MDHVCHKCGNTRLQRCNEVVQRHSRYLKDKYFFLVLRENFTQKTNIPCFARPKVLEMLIIRMDHETKVEVHIQTKEGFKFIVHITNIKDQTYFGCPYWKRLAKAYVFEVGMKICMRILDQPALGLMVHLPNPPVLHPSYFLASDETRRVVDKMVTTDGTIVSWEEMKDVIIFVSLMKDLVSHHNVGRYDGSVEPLVHELNQSNIDKKLLKIPRRVVPAQMHVQRSGDMRVVVIDEGYISSTYSTSVTDGCVIINGWRYIFSVYNIKIGDKLMAMLYYGDSGAVLFLDIMKAQIGRDEKVYLDNLKKRVQIFTEAVVKMVCPIFLAVSVSLTKLDMQNIDDRHAVRDIISPLAGFTLVSSILSALFLSVAKLFKGKLFWLYVISIYLCGFCLMILAFLTLLLTSEKHNIMSIPLVFFGLVTTVYVWFIVSNGHAHDVKVYETSGDKLENSVDFLAAITFLLFLGLGGMMLGGQYSTIQEKEPKYKELLFGSLWLSFTTCIAGVAVMMVDMLPPGEICGNKMKVKNICHILDGIDYVFGVGLALIVLLITHGTLRSWWAFGVALGMSIFPFGLWLVLVVNKILKPRVEEEEEEEEEVKPASLDLTKVTFTGFLGISVYTLNNCPDSINWVRFSFILLTAMAVNAGLGWRLFTHEKKPSPARFKAAYVASWCTPVCLALAVLPFAWMSFSALREITTTIPAPSPAPSPRC